MMVSATVNGRAVELETTKDFVSPAVARKILEGETYRIVPNLDGVRTVLDVGANVGAASVLFAAHYPEATVHAFEPAPATYELLRRNVAPFPNVVSHNFGLFDRTDERPLYRGRGSPGEASIFKFGWVSDESDMVELRSAREWAEEAGIESIDVLKVDTEGCELPILTGLSGLLPTVEVLYLEFHSKADWRALDELLRPTHEVFAGSIWFESGELMFVSHERYERIRQEIDQAHRDASV